ncbi:hypothetical protein UY3_04173 [Chelonia mydas]|uniref:Uncharacterized protein n=1 Tax=Chelonia mydas TaxID=8469 RepID=M7CCX0_CHEMY|nr:hypothetical protein UY3_04173 [Chelonia mydas]
MQSVALAGNKSDCWYCAHAPQLASTGIPWAAVPWNESWALNDTTFLTKFNETPPYRRQGTPVVILGDAYWCVQRPSATDTARPIGKLPLSSCAVIAEYLPDTGRFNVTAGPPEMHKVPMAQFILNGASQRVNSYA